MISWGIWLYVKPEHTRPLGLAFWKTTELAAQLIREFTAPTAVKVVVLFEAYYRCRTVVQACQE